MNRGFTLLEVLVVAMIMTFVAGLLVPTALTSMVMRERITREDRILADLAADIRASFESKDLDLFNISAVSGEIDAVTHPTVFSTLTNPTYPSVSGYEWFCKAARARGYAVKAGQPIGPTSQPVVYNLAYTDAGRPRLLIIDPNYAADPTEIRYLLLSVIGRADELVLPTFQNTATFFNDLWNTAWERNDAMLPASWTTALTAQQVSYWNSDTPGKTRLHCLRYVRIVQRKYPVTVNSNHPTDSVWVSWNNAAVTYHCPPASGTWTSPMPILAGRTLTISTGQAQATAVPTSILVREAPVFTSQ